MMVQVLQPEGHSLDELAWRLSRVRGKRVPKRTLQWWINELCIRPNEYGLYKDEALQILIGLVLFLRRCRSVRKFRDLLIKEMEANDS